MQVGTTPMYSTISQCFSPIVSSPAKPPLRATTGNSSSAAVPKQIKAVVNTGVPVEL